MSRPYTIKINDNFLQISHNSKILCLHDHGESIKRLEQYIEDDDYFGSLATHLDIVAQTFNKKVSGLGETRREYKLYLNRIRDELAYLQKHYRIIKKDNNEKLVG